MSKNSVSVRKIYKILLHDRSSIVFFCQVNQRHRPNHFPYIADLVIGLKDKSGADIIVDYSRDYTDVNGV